MSSRAIPIIKKMQTPKDEFGEGEKHRATLSKIDKNKENPDNGFLDDGESYASRSVEDIKLNVAYGSHFSGFSSVEEILHYISFFEDQPGDSFDNIIEDNLYRGLVLEVRDELIRFNCVKSKRIFFRVEKLKLKVLDGMNPIIFCTYDCYVVLGLVRNEFQVGDCSETFLVESPSKLLKIWTWVGNKAKNDKKFCMAAYAAALRTALRIKSPTIRYEEKDDISCISDNDYEIIFSNDPAMSAQDSMKEVKSTPPQRILYVLPRAELCYLRLADLNFDFLTSHLCFILITSARAYIWIGKKCKLCIVATCRVALHRIIDVSSNLETVEIREGEETPDFLENFGDTLKEAILESRFSSISNNALDERVASEYYSACDYGDPPHFFSDVDSGNEIAYSGCGEALDKSNLNDSSGEAESESLSGLGENYFSPRGTCKILSENNSSLDSGSEADPSRVQEHVLAFRESILNPIIIYKITNRSVPLAECKMTQGYIFDINILESSFCWVIDALSEVFVWIGIRAPIEIKSNAYKFLNLVVTSAPRPMCLRLYRIVEKSETARFLFLFKNRIPERLVAESE